MGKVKVGLFGIGLDTYWGQFRGLKERLLGYQQGIGEHLRTYKVEIIDAGLVDTPEKARIAANLFKTQDVEIIFLYISTYALSSTVLPVVQRVKVPLVILNLQPTSRIDYESFNKLGDRTKMTGEWLANCQACSVPELACVFNRAQIDFHQITGTLHDEESWQEIEDWLAAAKVRAVMRDNRVGVLGHYYCGMLDVYSDLTQHSAYFGCHIHLLEMCDLKRCVDLITDRDVQTKRKEMKESFEIAPDCSEYELNRAAKTACGLERLVNENNLGSIAYYYEGRGDKKYEDLIASVIVGNSLLTGKHIPIAGECEVKNVQAMKIMDSFGAGGSFTEFYAMDFDDNIVLMGHDGPGHIQIAEGKPILKPLHEYHGKPGKGLSVEMKVKYGPITVLSVVQTFDGKLKFIYAEGESVTGPILEIGNTNSRLKFPVNIKNFVNDWSKQGPAHHCALGIGHIGSKIEKLAQLIGIECIKVC